MATKPIMIGIPSRIAVFLIRIYQICISPILPRGICRFSPSCSQYAVEAYRKHGFWHGSWLAIKRLARCHPWHPGGEDPVP